MSIFTILFTAALVNNFVLSQFLGICPFLGVSFAIIIGNLFVPLIERYTVPKAFGKEGKANG